MKAKGMRQTTRRGFLRILAGSAAGGAVAAMAGPAARSAAALTITGVADEAAGAKKKPLNFIIILIDDMGWTDLGCFGSKYFETPQIDRFAAGAMKFTNGYAACCVCSPTRAAIMTGRYPARVGITDWIRARFQGGRGSADGPKLPEYEAPAAGKKVICPRNPFWLELEEVTIAEALKPAGYTSCHVGKWHLGPDAFYPTAQGFDYNFGGCDFGQPPSYFDPYTTPKLPGGIPNLPPRKEGEYLTDRETDEAIGFIRKHKDKPFFLYMAHYAVHMPLMSKPDLKAKYEAKTKTNQKNPTYAGMVQSVDDSTGKILAALDDLHLAEDTVVIFTSDNGGLLGPTDNAPLRAGKGWPYEGGIRVPLIVRWPGMTKPGSTSDVPVTSVDYFPTICRAAGVELPAGRTIDGVDIRPVLDGTGKLAREAIYWHFPHYRGTEPHSIVRAGDWKLIKRYDGRQFELFNLADDLSETTDLSDKMPEKVKELDAMLAAWLKDTGAKLPKSNPAYNAQARADGPFQPPLYD
jgi:arylsulfatase A-like enzyme